MKPAIRVENLAKSYRLGGSTGGGYRTIRETITDTAAAAWHALRGRQSSTGNGMANGAAKDNSFWALKNVSFEVQPGEVVGIIGRNGAGKSTLLKVLSRITEPTAGRCEVRGRISSLLEVGTGFHPELTGRENIYMNGSILGMKRKEIDRKFDEILAFSETERFLDTPVKRYSSGMIVRLAFSVAAHLEPEILIVDEVLAVGDAAFQKKCLGRMKEVGNSGRTILFVSHNMTAIKAMCNRGIYLSKGSIAEDGVPEKAIQCYIAESIDERTPYQDLRLHPRRNLSSRPIMTRVHLSSGDSSPTNAIEMGGQLSIHVELCSPTEPICPVLGVVIKDQYGAAVFGINNRIVPGFAFQRPMKEGKISCHYEKVPLMPGIYTMDLYLGDHAKDLDVIVDAISFEVLSADVFGSGKIPPSLAGPIFQRASWTVEAIEH